MNEELEEAYISFVEAKNKNDELHRQYSKQIMFRKSSPNSTVKTKQT